MDDYFNGTPNPARAALRKLLDEGDLRLVVPDLVMFEVLRGLRDERDFRQARLLFESLDVEAARGADLALIAAQHFRSLRASGITPRSSIDVLVATFCIEKDYALLHRGPRLRCLRGTARPAQLAALSMDSVGPTPGHELPHKPGGRAEAMLDEAPKHR